MKLLHLIKRYAGPYWPLIVLVVLFQFAQSVLSLLLPTINGDILNDGVLVGNTDVIWRLGGWMLVVSLLQIAANTLAILCGAIIAMRAGRDMRADVFQKASAFSEQDMQRFGSASLITRNTNDVQQVQMLILMSCTMLMSAPMLSIGGIVLAIRADATLSWIVAVAVPVMLIVMALIVSRLVPIFATLQEKVDAINRVMREQLTGIRVVRAFVQEKREKRRFDKANEDLYSAMLRTGNLFVLAFPLIMLIVEVSSVAVIWFGGHLVDSGELEIGTMMIFLQYLMQILMGIMMMTFMTMMIPRAAVGARRISEVIETEASVARGTGSAAPADGTVEFEGVSFSYPGADTPVLEDVTFTAHPGETVAIIGSTGAGKTTLVNLIARQFDVTAGSVRVGGVDVRESDTDQLWANLGLVPQRPYLFSGTVASNLRFGDENATEADLWQALEIAQAKGFVAEKGLDARVAQGGTNFSGGQRQRLSIARALVKRPRVLLFDDSFSALDTSTDARLRAALDAELSDITRIVVAQRVATVQGADRILVIESGRILDQGTHDELLETSETYREIVNSQMSVEA
ncbi:ABC transporter ATP-binding protein [Agrococcus casei]|uniref:Lipid A export ATP-binding/permease protein MsbA n=1 Tax=Agrococcus casei LMG 22410 TaxID=1255656 RepID=A0A1R4FDL7_9MICO|nr:ABC transporter ATP-binding protein [Agrococcus casei]SJM53998.1 Lipid A export ATP-binding/permease protein MsbA [Agrococcus casei LMG 22410]